MRLCLMQAAVAKLHKVLELVDARGACKPGSLLPAVHVTITCPRVTLRLRRSNELAPYPDCSPTNSAVRHSSSSSAGIIELSLHALHFISEQGNAACQGHELGVQSQDRHLLSIVNASIACFTVSNLAASANADGTTALIASSPAVREDNMQQQVILMAPQCRSQIFTGCSYQISSLARQILCETQGPPSDGCGYGKKSLYNVRHALQDFAKLIFGTSSERGSAFCKIALAPLDLLACHQTTLRVSDFTAAALPPPELNPVHMRVHVTLKEVVQDSLKGTQEYHMAVATPLKYEV